MAAEEIPEAKQVTRDKIVAEFALFVARTDPELMALIRGTKEES